MVTDARDVIRGGTVVLVATGGVPSDHVLAQRGPFVLYAVLVREWVCLGLRELPDAPPRPAIIVDGAFDELHLRGEVDRDAPGNAALEGTDRLQTASIRLRFSLHPVLHPADIADVEDVPPRRHKRLDRRGRELLVEPIDVQREVVADHPPAPVEPFEDLVLRHRLGEHHFHQLVLILTQDPFPEQGVEVLELGFVRERPAVPGLTEPG